MPMICHECGAIYPAAGICPKCFPTAGTKPATESTSEMGNHPETPADVLSREVDRLRPISSRDDLEQETDRDAVLGEEDEE